MDWTTITSQNKTSWQSCYDSSVILKAHFTQSFPGNDRVNLSSDLYTLSAYLYNSSSDGLSDSFMGSKFTNAGYNINYAEFETIDNADVMIFKEATGDKYLSNVWFDLANNKTGVLHIGLNTGGTAMAKFNTDATSTAVDIINLITATQSANNVIGNDYIIQPLYVYDEKTPLFVISGNTELAPFTLIQVQTRKFFVIGKGICVEVE